MTNFILGEPRLLFIHIPKTGGTSVREALGDAEARFFGHVPSEFRNIPSLSVIREPRARFLSAFRMFKYGNSVSDDYYSVARMPDLTITDALDILEDPWIGFDRSERSLLCNLKHHLIPQTHPFNCLWQVQSILRLENIDRDFAQFASSLRLEVELPKLRVSHGQQQIEDPWTKADEARFTRIFEEDFVKLEYSREEEATSSHASFHAIQPAFPSDATVYDIWPAYFSDRKLAVKNADTALPTADCSFEPFIDDIILGRSTNKPWAGRSRDLIEHFHKLQPEFGGASRLSHLLACLIVVLRRDSTNERARLLFWRILEEQFDVIRSELSLRWLVSISDTIADFGRSSGECAIGMCASVYANTTKLHETELKVFYPERPWPPNKRLNSGGVLFDGMISFWVEKGDLTENMFERSQRLSEAEPVAGKVLMEVIERLRKGPTVYRRFKRISGQTSVPILDAETRTEVEKLIKKSL